MSEGESQPPMTALSLDVMVPCDERYLPMLQQLAVRAVDYFAFSEDVRASLAQAIDCAMAGAPGSDYANVGILMTTAGGDLRLRVRYLGGPGGDGALESLLSQTVSGTSPLEQLRSGAVAVALGREDTHGAAEFCELTQPLP